MLKFFAEGTDPFPDHCPGGHGFAEWSVGRIAGGLRGLNRP